jgi:uncharacterized protein (TIGR03067 family)
MMRLWSVLLLAGVAVASAAEDKKDDAAKDELKKFEGTWELVSAERDVVKAPADSLKGMKAIAKGDMLTLTKDGNAFLELKITIDPTKKPKTIDATSTKGDDKGMMAVGIYELDGDTLTICLNRGKERPTEFTTKKDSGCTLYVYKREKK